MADPHSNALLYGAGVFTTIRVTGGKPMLWEKHWRRLTHDAERIGLDVSDLDEATILDQIGERISRDSLDRGRIRVTLSDRSVSPLWNTGNISSPVEIGILSGPDRELPTSFRVSASAYPVNERSPLAGIKSCNYLEPLASINEAISSGYDEAIRVNTAGTVVGGSMSNVFWTVAGELRTPSVQTGCLPGTMREYVIENLECREVEAWISELHSAERIFLTSAGIGVLRVIEFDGRRLDTSHHPILDLLAF